MPCKGVKLFGYLNSCPIYQCCFNFRTTTVILANSNGTALKKAVCVRVKFLLLCTDGVGTINVKYLSVACQCGGVVWQCQDRRNDQVARLHIMKLIFVNFSTANCSKIIMVRIVIILSNELSAVVIQGNA